MIPPPDDPVRTSTPASLKGLVAGANGHDPTLEDIFMQLTGKRLVEEVDEE